MSNKSGDVQPESETAGKGLIQDTRQKIRNKATQKD